MKSELATYCFILSHFCILIMWPKSDYTLSEDNSGMMLQPAELPGQGRGQQFWFVIVYTAHVLITYNMCYVALSDCISWLLISISWISCLQLFARCHLIIICPKFPRNSDTGITQCLNFNHKTGERTLSSYMEITPLTQLRLQSTALQSCPLIYLTVVPMLVNKEENEVCNNRYRKYLIILNMFILFFKS